MKEMMMMGLEEVVAMFEDGYKVFFGSYYGESEYTSIEEIRDEWEEDEADEWLYIESVEVDEEAKEVHVFVGDDE